MAERNRFFCPECDRGLSVPTEIAGKKIKCPQCATMIVVPAEGETDLVEQSKPNRVCPSCSASLAADAVLCVKCGLDLRTGKKLATSVSPAKSATPTVHPKLKGTTPGARKWYAPRVETAPARVLCCGKCSQEFWINNDATFIAWKDIINELQRNGTDVDSLPSGHHLFSDAVAQTSFEALPPEAADAERRRNLARLKQAADEPKREWFCLSCGAANRYGPPLDVSLDHLLDVLVKVFDMLVNNESRLRIGMDEEDMPLGRPKIFLSFHQHDPPSYVCDKLAQYGEVRSLTVAKAKGDELRLDVNRVVWLSKDSCVATGASNNAVIKLYLVRRVGRWRAKEMRSLFESYTLHGFARELYNEYGPAVLKALGLPVPNQ